jgi:hypothetical protein
MTNVLLFAALRLQFFLCFLPQPHTCETIPHKARLGAAKKKERVRRTEGRTGLIVGAHAIAGGKSACHDGDVPALRH